MISSYCVIPPHVGTWGGDIREFFKKNVIYKLLNANKNIERKLYYAIQNVYRGKKVL